jgi:hypothetical protein
VKGWRPHSDLTRLLAALGQEIVAGSDEEVRQLSGLSGHSMSGAAREVRTLIASVNDAQDEPDTNMPLAEAMHRRELHFRSH